MATAEAIVETPTTDKTELTDRFEALMEAIYNADLGVEGFAAIELVARAKTMAWRGFER